MPRKRNYITAFHGTSIENLPSILKHGLGGSNADTLWRPSLRGTTYLWSPKHLEEYGACEREDGRLEAERRAIQNAETALIRATDCRIIVIEVRIPEEWAAEDWSCPNMEGAIAVHETIPCNMFRSVRVSRDLSLFKAFIVALYFSESNPYTVMEPTWAEREICQALKNQSHWPMCEEYIKLTDIPLTKTPQQICRKAQRNARTNPGRSSTIRTHTHPTAGPTGCT